MAYPLPQNITSFNDLIRYTNNLTNGWLMPLFLFSVFVIAFFSLKLYKTHQAFAGASFITFILATIFRVLGFISTKILIVSIILLVVAVVWLMFAEKLEF